ncbi:lipid-binding SYLF domain-containing protein [Sulfurospirillum oryzae]|uniref:lipid-binding SYLF domain-containing protein n=1 Tax=Sulfurospirillum oryzae TaxID=2976535 RepID=UPI0021E6F64F|nr:lipid-binding SYLF domain-containing protein [Sulfurospirillum oryzae]
MMKKLWLSLLMGLLISTALYGSAEEKLLDSSNALKNMMRDSKIRIPQKVLDNAQAIAIFPATIEISMFLGGKTGNGVMVVRRSDGSWSYPFFVNLGGAGLGFQVGVEKKDILMIFKSTDSVKKLMNNKITLGVDASVAAGPAGDSAGRGSETDFKSEVYTYTKTQGAFVGVSFDGSVMNHDYDQNIELYGNNITPEQIIESDGLLSSYAIEEFLKAVRKLTSY